MKNMKDIGKSVVYWSKVLHLQHWTVHILKEPAGEDALADMRSAHFDHIAWIRIASNFFDGFNVEEQEKAILHELLHIHTRHVLDIAMDQSEQLSCDTQFALRTSILREMEYSTAALTDVIYEMDQYRKQEVKQAKKLGKNVKAPT